jgi:Fe2+ transport system protein FeoA
LNKEHIISYNDYGFICKINKPINEDYMTLDKLKIGSSAIITKVNGKGELRLRLLDMGLIPNTKVEVVKFAPLGDPMEIHIRGYELTLRLDDAKQIDIKENT